MPRTFGSEGIVRRAGHEVAIVQEIERAAVERVGVGQDGLPRKQVARLNRQRDGFAVLDEIADR